MMADEAKMFDFILSFNSDELNYDLVKERMGTISSAIVPMDVTGRIDRNKFIDKLLRAVMPEEADDLLVDQAQASKQLFDGVRQDVVAMMAGIEANYSDASNDPTAPSKLQYATQLATETPSIQQKLQSDQVFQQLFQNYIGNLQMGMQQQQNKQIGRMGVSPIQGGGGM